MVEWLNHKVKISFCQYNCCDKNEFFYSIKNTEKIESKTEILDSYRGIPQANPESKLDFGEVHERTQEVWSRHHIDLAHNSRHRLD